MNTDSLIMLQQQIINNLLQFFRTDVLTTMRLYCPGNVVLGIEQKLRFITHPHRGKRIKSAQSPKTEFRIMNPRSQQYEPYYTVGHIPKHSMRSTTQTSKTK
ncbi:hypothetical protein pb186bvf_011053 [Paramecium bursaria]